MGYLDRLFPEQSQPMATNRAGSEGAKKRSLPFKAPSRVDSGATTSKAKDAKVTSAKAAPKKSAATSSKVAAAAAARKNAPATVGAAKSAGFKSASKVAPVVLSSDRESEEDEEEDDDLDEEPREPVRKKQRRQAIEEGDEEDGKQDEEHSDEDEPAPAPARKPTARSRPSAADEDSGPPIPQKLLTRLLYEGFEDKNMKIGKEAMNVVSKYVETFVREALARAVFEREEADQELGKAGSGDGFLQVEDLEKLAPQLLLDF